MGKNTEKSKKRKLAEKSRDEEEEAAEDDESSTNEKELNVVIEKEGSDTTGALIISFKDAPPPLEVLHTDGGALACTCSSYTAGKGQNKYKLREVTAQSETL